MQDLNQGEDFLTEVKSSSFFNQNDIKPIFPENPPPKLIQKLVCIHNMVRRQELVLKNDPISANSMPLTGDPRQMQ